jgi:hypothetical protein
LGGLGFCQPIPLPSLTSIYIHLIKFLTFLSKSTGTRNPSGVDAGAVFHPQVWVSFSTRQLFGVDQIFGESAPKPIPNPPRYHPYTKSRKKDEKVTKFPWKRTNDHFFSRSTPLPRSRRCDTLRSRLPMSRTNPINRWRRGF